MQIIAKEFINNPYLTEYIIPPDITSVGEWAFARCRNLHTVYIPAGCSVSNRSFEKCPALSEVYIYEHSPVNPIPGYPHLLALALRTWDREADAFIDNAVDNSELIVYFDNRLYRYLDAPDDDGFDPFLAGGEEDYDDASALKDYIRDVRLAKVNLMYERLSIAAPVSDKLKGMIMDRLIRYNPDISFAALTPQSEANRSYRELYFELELYRQTDLESLLRIAENDTRLRAMILEHSQDGSNAIDGLIL